MMSSISTSAETASTTPVDSRPALTRRPTAALRWFSPLPVAMLLDPGLSSDAKVLAGILLHYDGPSGCHPKIETLMRDMNASKNKMLRLVEELERFGFLLRTRKGRNNFYALRPVYERPIRPDSFEATGELECANSQRRKPEHRNALHKRRPPETDGAVESVPAVEPIPLQRRPRSPAQVPSMEPISPDHPPAADILQVPALEPERQRSVPAVESDSVPALERDSRDRFHQRDLDMTNNHSTKNHQYQNDAADGDEIDVADGILALLGVGVHISKRDLGINTARQRALNGNELDEWARWVTTSSSRRIANKEGFCASKIRVGYTVADAFSDVRARLEREQRTVQERKRIEELELTEAVAKQDRQSKADALIAQLPRPEREALREHALNDTAVWIARNANRSIFTLMLAEAERRLVLNESVPSQNVRDRSAYRELPSL